MTTLINAGAIAGASFISVEYKTKCGFTEGSMVFLDKNGFDTFTIRRKNLSGRNRQHQVPTDSEMSSDKMRCVKPQMT